MHILTGVVFYHILKFLLFKRPIFKIHCPLIYLSKCQGKYLSSISWHSHSFHFPSPYKQSYRVEEQKGRSEKNKLIKLDAFQDEFKIVEKTISETTNKLVQSGNELFVQKHLSSFHSEGVQNKVFSILPIQVLRKWRVLTITNLFGLLLCLQIMGYKIHSLSLIPIILYT